MLEHSLNLDLLKYAIPQSQSHRHLERLAPWCPDLLSADTALERRFRNIFRLVNEAPSDTFYEPSSGVSPSCGTEHGKFLVMKSILACEGYQLGTIKSITNQLSTFSWKDPSIQSRNEGNLSFKLARRVKLEWESLLDKSMPHNYSGGWPNSEYSTLQVCYRLSEILDESYSGSFPDDALSALRLETEEEQQLVLVPEGCRPGDIICHAAMNLPILLRPIIPSHNSEEEMTKIMGSRYMAGEIPPVGHYQYVGLCLVGGGILAETRINTCEVETRGLQLFAIH